MYQARMSDQKELITTIAVKRLEIKKLEKELQALETEERESLCRRYGVE
jgi:hypothetical protein